MLEVRGCPKKNKTRKQMLHAAADMRESQCSDKMLIYRASDVSSQKS